MSVKSPVEIEAGGGRKEITPSAATLCSAPTPWPYDYGQTAMASIRGFKPRYVSDCCGASTDAEGGMETGICPHCREHCEFVDERGCGND